MGEGRVGGRYMVLVLAQVQVLVVRRLQRLPWAAGARLAEEGRPEPQHSE